MQLPHSPTLVVIAGPTASGKTALGVWLASLFKTEILSADSRQCFRELNIGVARPSIEELSQIKHHFIASHSIFQPVNAGIYSAYGLKILKQLFRGHRVVIAVGGTGLYIKALTEGIDTMPPISAEIRQDIIGEYASQGLPWLQSAVAREDPVFWRQAERSNPQRLMRALEFIRSHGTSIVNFHSHQKQSRSFNVINIALDLPRDLLYDRINQRVDIMIRQGLEAEVRGLYALRHLNALQTVGYKEWFPYFENAADLIQVTENIKRNTRHYAKRQVTWFKKQEAFQWFSPSDKENILSFIKSTLDGPDSV